MLLALRSLFEPAPAAATKWAATPDWTLYDNDLTAEKTGASGDNHLIRSTVAVTDGTFLIRYDAVSEVGGRAFFGADTGDDTSLPGIDLAGYGVGYNPANGDIYHAGYLTTGPNTMVPGDWFMLVKADAIYDLYVQPGGAGPFIHQATVDTTGRPAAGAVFATAASNQFFVNEKFTGDFSGWGAAAGTAYNDNLTETAAAVDAASATQTFVSAAVETAAAGDDFAAGLTIAGSLNEATTPNDSLTTAMTFAPTVTESAAANDNLATQATFATPLTESAAAADTVNSTQTSDNALTESAAAADSVSGGLLVAGSLNEALTPSDALTTAATFAAPLTESASAQADVAGQAVMGSALGESAGAGDDQSAAAAMPNALGESAGATDAESASQVFNEALTEGATATDGLGVDGTTTYNDVVSESLAATLGLGVGLVIPAAFAETATAADQVDGATVLQSAAAEQALAGDQAAASVDYAAGISEAAAANDEYSAELISRLTHQSAILQAIKALVTGALPETALGYTADFRKAARAGQREIGFPLGPDEFEYELGGTYALRMGVDIVLTAPGGAGGAALDDMAGAIGAAVAADRTLGGLADWLEAKAARAEGRSMRGIASSNFATVTIVAEYRTRNPLAA